MPIRSSNAVRALSSFRVLRSLLSLISSVLPDFLALSLVSFLLNSAEEAGSTEPALPILKRDSTRHPPSSLSGRASSSPPLRCASNSSVGLKTRRQLRRQLFKRLKGQQGTTLTLPTTKVGVAHATFDHTIGILLNRRFSKRPSGRSSTVCFRLLVRRRVFGHRMRRVAETPERDERLRDCVVGGGH